ncbi:cell division protein SepF [Gracilibacillus caseinilyticus]|uniref:Cell division protein SepF n=1 Tax=Gracilibacillus caseinilyticus TaxID=2932256 RepID=A0ABY4EU58_9BACI|nr:cell division protein SepF [Gracilibacillus caseinilyticus]UOQ47946.1 cell division protein SepF [Gracilibacillus caseinilyticus]
MSMKGKFRNLFGLEDEEYEIVEEELEQESSAEAEPMRRSQRKEDKTNVVSLSSVQKNTKMVLCEPRNYNEVQDIADHIVNRRSVVINLQRVDNQQARQIIDFMSGTVYAVSGQIKKLGSQTFLCTPENIEISGNITEIMEEVDPEQRW